MLVPPRLPSLSRWRLHSTIRYSVLRSLEYEVIKGLELNGLIIDVGGGEHNSYYPLLKINGTIESVNIDNDIKPTYIGDLNGRLPIDSERYDTLISLNTLEHIRDDHNALNEMSRVLKPGGIAHIIVPFLYRVHGSPNDYHRHTASAWIEMLTNAGFARDTISIEPLIFGGGLTAAFSLVEFLIPGLVRRPVKALVLLLATLRRNQATTTDFPLGFYISGHKPVEERN